METNQMKAKRFSLILIFGLEAMIFIMGRTSVLARPSGADICDIAAIDFSNRIIETKNVRIILKNGAYIQNDKSGVADWRFELSPDTSLYHFGKDTIRIINIGADHLSGSGSWQIAVGFVCSGDQVKKVLEQWSLDRPVISQNGDNLSVTVSTEYRGAAPPQGKTAILFKWRNGAFARYEQE
jgi:hypothetical protein